LSNQSLGNCHQPRWRGRHPQHPAPEATASAFAASPQQLPDACASAAVPQQVLACGVIWTVLVAAGLPQQPAADAGGLSASAGSPTNPPTVCFVSVLIAFSFSNRN
jgi:hypothetical protein